MKPSLHLADRTIEAAFPAFIMGILNATPDSFWSGSRIPTLDDGLEAALAMEAAGADILDIGGESTRPGSSYVDASEEISRIVPLIRLIRTHSKIPISVDIRKTSVLHAALDAGADILNDISALCDDPGMALLASQKGIPVILMHKQGIPETMQHNPAYSDPVGEVSAWLVERARFAEERGIMHNRIILDPGIGFGKKYEHNIALIAGLAKIVEEGYPVLMALSRKSCIGQITGREIENRLAGSLAANLISVQNGATFLRVHDVSATRDMLAVLQETGIRGTD